MRNVSWVVLFLVLAIVVGGTVFLSTWNIPAPVSTVEKVVPDARFPK